MNLKEYQEQASRTCPDLGNDLNELHMRAGILTEFGELLDIFKKRIAYNKEIDIINVGEECADIAWYRVNQLRMQGTIFTESYIPAKILEEPIDFTTLSWLIVNYYGYEPLSIIYTITTHFNLDFFKLLDNNIAKLKIRYPEKFDTEKALNRDLISERKELEK